MFDDDDINSVALHEILVKVMGEQGSSSDLGAGGVPKRTSRTARRRRLRRRSTLGLGRRNQQSHILQ